MNILFPLSITLAFETLIYMLLKRRDFKLFIVVSLLNLILNPAMNTALQYVNDPTTYWIILIISEVSTVVIESLVIFFACKFKYLKVLLFAFIANLASFTIGFVLSPVYNTKITIIVLMAIFFAIYLTIYIITLVHFISQQLRKDHSPA